MELQNNIGSRYLQDMLAITQIIDSVTPKINASVNINSPLARQLMDIKKAIAENIARNVIVIVNDSAQAKKAEHHQDEISHSPIPE